MVTKPLLLALALAFCVDARAQAQPFAPASFAPVQPAPERPSPQRVTGTPAVPGAPPLPFRYIGRLQENGKLEVLLMRGEQLLSVAAGETAGEYRVDDITSSAIAFTYLPLKTKQSLDLPGVN